MTTYDYPYFLCSWLASDKDGNIGTFQTGGEGIVPLQMLQVLNEFDVQANLLEMAVVSGVRVVMPNECSPQHEALAERGLYVYRWNDTRGEYYLVAEPTKPITRDGLSQKLRDVVPDLALSRVSFANALSINVKNHVECVDW